MFFAPSDSRFSNIVQTIQWKDYLFSFQIMYKSQFKKKMNHELQAELACRDEGRTLNQFIELAIQIDNLLRARRPTTRMTTRALPESHEPMQVDAYHISAEERDRRIAQRLCLYCGEPGHLRNTCPSRPPTNATTRVSVTLDSLNRDYCFTVPVTLRTESETLNIAAMIDLGAAGNFMSEDFAHKNNIPLIYCLSPLAVEAVDGRPLGSGRITQLTTHLTLVTGALHQEIIQFYIISTLQAPVILGLPWLRKHDPSMSQVYPGGTHRSQAGDPPVLCTVCRKSTLFPSRSSR